MQIPLAKNLIQYIKSDSRISECNVGDEKENFIFGKIVVNEYKINFIIMLNNFPLKLPEYFILKDDIPYLIPHAYSNSKLKSFYWICYTRKENLFWNVDDSKDIILSSFNAFYDCVNKGINKSNGDEFKGEFIYFWQRSSTPEKRMWFKSYIAPDDKVKLVKYNPMKLIYDDIKDLYCFHKKDELDNVTSLDALYIPIKKDFELIPPLNGEAWSNEYIEQILNNGVNTFNMEILEKIITEFDFDIIVFSMPFETSNIFWGISAIGFSKSIGNSNNLFSINNLTDIKSVIIDNYSRDYLKKRSGASNEFLNKKILILGVGSVGSQIANQLCLCGYEKLTIVDKDKLSKDNIYRHYLGKFGINSVKTIPLKISLESNFPYIEVTNVEKDVMELLKTPDFFRGFDVIISALGNPVIERELNKLCFSEKLPPIIYNWVEPLGVAGHALMIFNKYRGCFNCLFLDIEGKFNFKNKLGIAKLNTDKPFTKDFAGCGNEFTPYGGIDAIQTSLVAVNLIKDFFEEEISTSTLRTYIGNTKRFQEFGFSLSEWYYQLTSNSAFQKKSIYYEIINFNNSNCEVCKKNEF